MDGKGYEGKTNSNNLRFSLSHLSSPPLPALLRSLLRQLGSLLYEIIYPSGMPSARARAKRRTRRAAVIKCRRKHLNKLPIFKEKRDLAKVTLDVADETK